MPQSRQRADAAALEVAPSAVPSATAPAVPTPPVIPDAPARATLADVAQRAGVSRSTASRGLTGRGYVAPAARERILLAAEELGYVPDGNARSLKARHTPAVGLLVSDLRNRFYAEVAAGASSVLRDEGYTIVLVDDTGSDPEEVAAARTVLAMRVAGVLVTPVSAAVSQLVARHGVPLVEIDRQFCRGECDAVLVDNVTGARELTEHLLGLGHRRIALLVNETGWTTSAGRIKGYHQAWAAAGREVPADGVEAVGFDPDQIEDKVGELLSRRRPPTAVFAANNVVAEAVWRQSARLGLRIPDDLSFVAFDDSPWMSMVSPGITTVAQPSVELGARAARLLLSRMAKPGRPRTTRLDCPLIVRGSTARLGRRRTPVKGSEGVRSAR
ncbi:LacI family DNA-binding transcriptional regulator [Actinopolymorpha rutila]|uniref:LacI family transcriptional regulator n=1 Tax=Actinopolymorpha rutila TaxID=446787 RepID=A0A852ZCZ3_9ACTN|nr:LacI family transcriptional regulator [Actinopolymorpha rutila]